MAATDKGILIQNKVQQSKLHDPNTEKLGTYYLTDNPQHYEIQRTNSFVFYVEGLNGELQIPDHTYAQANAEDILKISVNSSSVPHFSQNTIEVNRGNNTMKFAGKPTFGEGSIKLHDFIGAGTKEVLMAWQSKSYDVKTEKVGLARDYKKTAYLLEYTPEFQLVRSWKLHGCWVSGISESGYSYDNADKNMIDVTIQYDKAELDYNPED